MLGQLLLKLSNYLLQLFQQLTTKAIDDSDFLAFVNERTSSFLQFLLLLNQHPFHQLSLNAYQALNTFLVRQPSLLSNESFCLKLILNLKQSLHRVHFSTSSIGSIESENEIIQQQYRRNEQSLLYALFEYDSEEQFFWKFFSQYRSELQKLIKSFVGMYFTEPAQGSVRKKGTIDIPFVADNLELNIACLRSILQNLLTYLETLVQRTPTNIPSVLTSTYLIIEWEAVYLLLDHVLFIIRRELFSSATTTIKSQQQIESILIGNYLAEQFLRTIRFLLQFTPNISEHIHGHTLNLLSCMFFMTQHDSPLAIQIIQRLLSTYQFYQQQLISTARHRRILSIVFFF
jgi:hypothetical protein